ncbi:MAG: hypothetical protein R6W90_04900 [Ignavibacteriaceae bacterium]
MDVVTIFYILLLLSASALCIAAIIYLRRITRSVGEVETDIKDLSLQLKPLIASVTNLSERLNNISEQAKGQVQVTKSIVNDFRDRADRILSLEEKIRNGIEEPVNVVIKYLSALVNGVNTFWDAYKKDSK